MQRSITNQNYIKRLFYLVIFAIYINLSSIYVFLPPMFAVLYFYFKKSLDKKQNGLTFVVILFLIYFEADKGYIFFSSVMYFWLLYKVIMPKVEQNMGCETCIKFINVTLVYIGYFLFALILSNIFMLPLPHISLHVMYYILIEYFIVSIL